MIGGNIDTTTSVCHGPTGMAFQGLGESTASLGEIKNRADLVIFWGGNPAEAHPRLFTRYAVTPKGMYTPNGRKDRTVVLVDVRRTASTPVADIFLQVKPGSDFEVLWALRALVKGRKVDASIEERTGISLAVLEDLTARMKRCQFGALLFGMGLTMTRGRHFNAGALLALATDLNAFTHFVAAPVRGHGNVTGADNVVSWQTGYPVRRQLQPWLSPLQSWRVDHRGPARPGRGRRRDDHCERSRGEFRQGSDRAPQAHSGHHPRSQGQVTSQLARVAFTTATYGINVPGTVYRMDNVPITLRPAFESPYPSDEQVLTAIRDRVRTLLGGNRIPAGTPLAATAT